MSAWLSSSQPATWTPCYVALGSNLDSPAQQVRRALVELNNIEKTRLINHSSLYESAPIGPLDQPNFVNAVAGLLTQLTATQLLRLLQRIEQRMGRVASTLRWAPRVIDLDMLMFGDLHSDSTELQLPHPGLLLRNFVMAPLAELAPELAVAKTRNAAQVARELGMHGVRRLSDAI
jgi:2-amino-4-hydroxy-6-hydroxymethyldihydropteridine diphosphokinase